MDLLSCTGLKKEILHPMHSDALFAAFAQKYDTLSFDVVNDFIGLLRMRDFDSQQLTLDSIFEIPVYISEQSQATLHRRELKESPVPQLIVDLIADQLAQESPSIFAGGWTSTSHETLSRMTHVHRSWASSAQRVLRRSVTIRSRNLNDLRRLPQLGPWVREIYFGPGHGPEFKCFGTLLAGILRVCPNVRHLLIKSDYSYRDDVAFNEVIRELPNLSSLKHLWIEISASNISPSDLRLFSLVLPKLRTLKVLTLSDWTEKSLPLDSSEQVSAEEMELPVPTLTSLCFKHCRISDKNLLSTLFHPRRRITSLELDPSLYRELPWPLAMQAVNSVLSNITNFRLHLRQDSADQACLATLAECGKLRQLNLVLSSKPLLTPVLTIPKTLEQLWIYHQYAERYRNGTDEYIVQTIRRLPNLKMLTITLSSRQEMAVEQVEAYCSEKSIELIVNRDVCLPYFFEYE